uniref:Secreted protein n=1 Tax=Mus musculus TaxID=10090 RepID=Q3TRL6_MOUSE|nr:unnamed protein product [Mus musculus]
MYWLQLLLAWPQRVSTMAPASRLATTSFRVHHSSSQLFCAVVEIQASVDFQVYPSPPLPPFFFFFPIGC